MAPLISYRHGWRRSSEDWTIVGSGLLCHIGTGCRRRLDRYPWRNGSITVSGFEDQDFVALTRKVFGIPAGTCGSVIGIDREARTVVVSFVDRSRRPIGVERVPEAWLCTADRDVCLDEG